MAAGGKKLINDSQPFVRLHSDREVKFSFSFRFFKQIDYFGIGDAENKWFASLFQRLSDMSQKSTEIFGNYGDRDTYRLHTIDWEAKNIPIAKSDLNWIPKDYLENEEEYPLWQFELSTGTGRVVGFLDENSIFNIVLFDPKHNLQPSKKFGYKVEETSRGLTEVELTKRHLGIVLKKMEKCTYRTSCPIGNPSSSCLKEALIVIDDELLDVYIQLRHKEIFQHLFEEFLLTRL